MRPLLALLTLLACNSTALAELTVTSRAAQTVVTVTPEIVTQIQTADGTKIGQAVVETGLPDAKPAAPAVLIYVQSDRDLTKSLVKIKCSTADVKLVETGVYVVTTAGRHVLDVNVISEAPLQWDDESVTVTVGNSPTPNPGPDPEPEPTPDPSPIDIAKTEGSWILIIEQTENRSLETAKLIRDIPFWQSVQARGLNPRPYDYDAPEAKPYRATADAAGMPVVIIVGGQGELKGHVLATFPLPGKAALDAKIKEVTGR